MCSSLFGRVEMESYQGDLTDIVRGNTAGSSSSSSTSDHHHHHLYQYQHQHHRHVNIINHPLPSWDLQFPSHDLPSNLTSTTMDDQHRAEISLFGDPFSYMRDPLLLHEVEYMSSSAAASATAYYNTTTTSTPTTTTTTTNTNTTTTCSVEEGNNNIKTPCNIFSRIQISSPSQTPKLLPAMSPCDSSPPPPLVVMPASSSPRGIKPPSMLTTNMINVNTTSKTTSCLLDNTTVPVQISSPRNLGIKRRKSQAKKVVCIPAPAAANSRSSGEVVPSDLWAWRKYGQKPIKGSPYPRGYYRCSSSKGCSARKQVERSRTDPNMLVITYTSEHNHPWPTQRNALAGSTRSQPSKTSNSNNNNNNANASSSKNSPSSSQLQNNTKDNELMKESSNETMSPVNVGGGSSSAASVKEEFELEDAADHHHHHLDQGFPQIYKPALSDHDIHSSNNQSHEDFFAELGEIEADPLDLLFTQGFSTSTTGDHDQKQSKTAAAELDPFTMFDWSAGDDHDTHNNNNSPGDQEATKRGL